MNLADIRKKSEEKRQAVTVVSAGTAEEIAILPEMAPPEELVIQKPAFDNFEVALEDNPEETCFYDTGAMELNLPLTEESVYNVEPLPGSAAVMDAVQKVCEPVSSVAAAPAKSSMVYNAIQTIISGREAAADADENAISQALSYEAEAVEEFLCFRVAQEWYAISIMAIKEIVKPRDVTAVPRMPAFILGVISLRGVIIPVMDMRLRLSLSVSPATGRERIIVLKMDTDFCGVLVDEVIQVARIKKSGIEDPPAVLDGIDRDFVTGLGHFDNRMLIILNLGTILDIGVH